LQLPGPRDAPLGVVENTAIAHEGAPFRRGDDVAERRNAILPWPRHRTSHQMRSSCATVCTFWTLPVLSVVSRPGRNGRGAAGRRRFVSVGPPEGRVQALYPGGGVSLQVSLQTVHTPPPTVLPQLLVC